MNADYFVFGFTNVLLALLVSPLYMGLIRKVKAAVQRRRGPPLLQPYYNIIKLMRKERIYSTSSSWIMRSCPYVNITLVVVASLCVPLAFVPYPPLGIGNVILFLYMLSAARFFMALAGLDAASTFGGMGSSREMSISSVVEPVTVVVFAALAFTLKSVNFHEMFQMTAASGTVLDPAFVLLAIPLFIVLIAETARVPVDNPETHLELTMIHEAMLLEFTGRDLALMELSHAVKQTLLMGVIINVLFPWGIAMQAGALQLLVGVAAFLAKGALLSAIIGLFESASAKMRLFALPNMFMVAFFLAVITILLGVFK